VALDGMTPPLDIQIISLARQCQDDGPDEFLDLARTGSIELTISDDILAEVTRVLRGKFG
jgi:hypothetical protein